MTTYRVDDKLQKGDMLIVPIFTDKVLPAATKTLDEQTRSLLETVCNGSDFEGNMQQTSLVYTTSKEFPRVLLLGLGDKKEKKLRKFKEAIGSAILFAQAKKATELRMFVPTLFFSFTEKEMKDAFQELVIAAGTAAYAFDDHKEKDAQTVSIKTVSFIGELGAKQKRAAGSGIKDGMHIVEAMNLTRRLGNTPPSIMTPSYLAKEVQQLGKKIPALKVKVLSRTELQKLGMGCFLGVAQGSAQEPKFIIVEYFAGKKTEKPTVLVGKGITFDSGGLSLKPDPYMSDMKFDMLGAATALGSIYAAALLGIKKNLVALMPACENMPSGTAYRPDDILTAMNGKTVHIDNTDAEGRLILADALCYASKYTPKEVIDFATLTGACVVALGNERSGLFSQDEKIVAGLLQSAEQVGERLWRLPLGEEYSEAMKSDVADLKNLGGVGGPRYAGASTAAAFLEYFTNYPWAHIDLSCSYYGGKGKSWIRGGANGFGIQTMIAYLR